MKGFHISVLDCADAGEGQALALREKETFFVRSAGALGCHTRIRAGFPREHWMARVAWRGTGFPTALREKETFFCS